MKILLLNPPGDRAYVRDYYCSKVSKSNYLFQPIDLVMLSGVLASDHELRVCDAIADGLTDGECLGLIRDYAPDALVSLAGAVCLEHDLAFLAEAANHTGQVLVSGDAFLDGPVCWLERYPFLAAIILDFTSDDTARFLAGQRTGLPALAFPGGTLFASRPKGQCFSIPTPRHDLFTSPNYRFPFVRDRRFATVLTDYGCPYPCTFCVMATLGYRYRQVEDVIGELDQLRKLGMREIFFADQSFGVMRDRAVGLCEEMIANGYGFGWVCFSRVDLLDRELLRLMKRAGCHTVILGVESASDDILSHYRKGYCREQIIAAFELCRETGIRTVATFIIGLPEETRETARNTIDFLKHLCCDFASFNMAVPRAGTPLREIAIESGLAASGVTCMDQTGTTIAMPSLHLTMEEIGALRREAIRAFYLRPGYLLRRIASIRSRYELFEQVREAFHLLVGSLPP